MQTPLRHEIHQQNFWLSPDRCVYWEEEQALILSDLHFGKTGHFRKSGIAVPQSVFKDDIQRLVDQLQFFNARQLIVVGDMFHSHANKEHELFMRWRNDFPHLTVHLVKGNHDILKKKWYTEANILLHDDCLEINQFSFMHDLSGCPDSPGQYFFTGHIHPGISISGIAKQSLKFPCFYFTEDYAVLPAFSRFTGLAMIDPKRNEDVFAIVENKVIAM